MNLMVKMGSGLAHVWTSTGRILALIGVCLFAAAGFAAESISITATPRYPWNGKVDLKFTIDGTSGTKYDTSFTAKDVAGGTNLTMRTLYKSDGTAANAGREWLLPGTYNWVWDATADLTSRWAIHQGCVPTNSAVLFSNVQLSELAEFYAVPCGKSVSDKSNLAKGTHIKNDGAGKAVQFAFPDDVYTKCVCIHLEQSGANVVGYAKWARYVSGTGYEGSDFDTNSATTMGIATSESERGYGLYRLEAKGVKLDSSPVLERVVAEGNVEVSAFLYTVKFNANGGTGTMENESFAYGIGKALTANAFKRTGYTFQGWATSSGGAVVYKDKQYVTNLTSTAGATVNLYAVWKEALYMVIDLSGGSSAKSYPVSYLSEVPNNGTWPDEYKTTKLVLRKVKKGSNTAGGSMAKDMWVGVFELTQRQTTQIYGTFLKKGNYNGYAYAYLTIGEKYPMIRSLESNVELGETINTRMNSRVSSLNFVIPTKDQWIYACRAGTTTSYNNGASDEVGLKKVAVCLKNSTYYTAYEDVGSRDPNAWGLYDMHGNVSERVGSVTKKDYGVTGIYYYITCMGGWFNGTVNTCKADSERLELAYQSFSNDSASGAADRNSYGYRVFAVTK